jgi:hypothetical protein
LSAEGFKFFKNSFLGLKLKKCMVRRLMHFEVLCTAKYRYGEKILHRKIKFFFKIFFISGMDASFSEIFLYYTVMIPAAPQETVGEAGIEPGTAA